MSTSHKAEIVPTLDGAQYPAGLVDITSGQTPTFGEETRRRLRRRAVRLRARVRRAKRGWR